MADTHPGPVHPRDGYAMHTTSRLEMDQNKAGEDTDTMNTISLSSLYLCLRLRLPYVYTTFLLQHTPYTTQPCRSQLTGYR